MEGHTGIKLFVRGIPRSFLEEDMKAVLEPFGEVAEVIILKDSATQVSKGCGFCLFKRRASADACLEAMDGKFTFPSMTRPCEVRWANKEGPDSFKIFFALAPPSCSAEEISNLFSQAGTVRDVFLMKRPDQTSKGCGFVRMDHKGEAERAIALLNGSTSLPGSEKNLVVRFADTDKEKETAAAQAAVPMQMPVQPTMPMPTATVPQLNPQGAMGLMQMFPQLYQQLQQPGALAAVAAALAPQSTFQQPQQQPIFNPVAAPQSVMATMYNQPAAPQPPLPPVAPVAPSTNTNKAVAQVHLGDIGEAGLPLIKNGPAGANLFVYNFPPTYTQKEVVATFSPYGTVIACNIAKNPQGQSKCYGFVSYDSPAGAQVAVSTLNGFMIGDKKLKVDFKKDRGAY